MVFSLLRQHRKRAIERGYLLASKASSFAKLEKGFDYREKCYWNCLEMDVCHKGIVIRIDRIYSTWKAVVVEGCG